jgi:hypothetical protein
VLFSILSQIHHKLLTTKTFPYILCMITRDESKSLAASGMALEVKHSLSRYTVVRVRFGAVTTTTTTSHRSRNLSCRFVVASDCWINTRVI